MPMTDGQDLFACTVDESAGMADEFPPDCSDLTCRRCRACYSRYVERKMAGELDQPLSFCTSSEDCTADVDAHKPDCPVEAKLKDTFGF